MPNSPNSPIGAEELYHVGIIVDDPQATMSELTELFGYEWGERLGGPITVHLPDGETTIDLHAWYSMTAPRVEIVQSIPGTVWTPADGSGVHHLGYWVDDVDAASAHLERAGWATEAVGRRPGGAAYWAYHRSPAGPRVEIVARAVKTTMDNYFATGKVSS